MLYNIEKLLADSQANAILTKGNEHIILTVTACPEVAAGELGRWVMAKYTIAELGHTLHVVKRTNMFEVNARFQNSLELHRATGFVFANEELTDIILGSKLSKEKAIEDYPIYEEEINHFFLD